VITSASLNAAFQETDAAPVLGRSFSTDPIRESHHETAARPGATSPCNEVCEREDARRAAETGCDA